MKIQLGFGHSFQELEIPEGHTVETLLPNAVTLPSSAEEEIKRALTHPIGTPRLRELVREGGKTVIITSDITRPLPSSLLLPPLLEELEEGGIDQNDILVVFALGNHRPHTQEEQKKLLGAAYGRVKAVDSNAKDCVRLGFTSRGTPVDIFRPVAEAKYRICLGNIEYHYFAGYSGGIKAIMPGVSTPEAIQNNHSLMVQPGARTGILDGNPVREDMEEVGEIVPVDFILNVVLDENKQIVKAVAGHYKQAHRAGCAFLDDLYQVKISQPADIVIVSAGGFPKDINLYQAQKALDNAQRAVRPGGIIILVAACPEGLGEKVFARWVNEAARPEDLIARVRQHFELGGHKAAAIALVLQQAKVYLVSGLPREQAAKLFMEPFSDVNAALAAAIKSVGQKARIAVIPFGGSTLPAV